MGLAVIMRLLLIGASVRAAAGSLRRLGVKAVAYDLYRDTDLVAMADARQIPPDDYPGRIWDQVRHLPVIPWIYTGAIENHPTVVETISGRFPLLGNGRRALELVRDPFWLAEVTRFGGFLMPEVRASPAGIATDGSWLVKPVASGGGEGISPWRGLLAADPGTVYFQARLAGRSLGATFVRDDSGCHWIGLTRQYLGRPGNPFAYRGSLGPWPVSESTQRTVVALGRLIGDQADLRGLFGLDLMEAEGRVWLIEVNPRYTASVEVLEIARNRSILSNHLQAFGITTEAAPAGLPTTAAVVGKVILSARSSGRLGHPISAATAGVADIPHAGTYFEWGQPIMTVFGRGDSVGTCRRDLARRVRLWKSRVQLLGPRQSDLSIDQKQDGRGGDQETEDHPRQADRLADDFPPGFMP